MDNQNNTTNNNQGPRTSSSGPRNNNRSAGGQNRPRRRSPEQGASTEGGQRSNTAGGPGNNSRRGGPNSRQQNKHNNNNNRRGGGGGGGKRRGNTRFKRRPDKAPALTHRLEHTDRKSVHIPEITDEDTVRIIPVSGVEEIGRNMNIIETKDDIIVVDAGFQFVSAESNAPGINYILPNTQYLEERKHKIRALVVTHGHLDHIGGIPFIMERIGNPPIYTQYLTSLMILKRQEEFPQMDPVKINVIKEGESFTVGKTRIKTFRVTHSIPDAMGACIETKHGDVVLTGDIKITNEDGVAALEEKQSWEEVGTHNNLALLCDSTNADRSGWSMSENVMFRNLEDLIRTTKGRLIVGTFASQFDRLTNIIEVCEELGKKVVLEGRSIKTNIDIAIKAKLVEVKNDTFISANDMKDYPADRIVILSTGAQGEKFAALMRMATDKHKFVTLSESDTLILSSSVIPGNEIAVQILKDNLYRKNVRIINYKSSVVHSSGHGNAGELAWVHKTLKPKFLIPVHGHHFHLKNHMYAAIENGFPRENITVPDNGTIIDIKNGSEVNVHKTKIPTELVMVDGFTVGTRQEVVLRDRLTLSEDGMFVIIATVDGRTGRLRKSPDIISRGFVYLRENQQLLSEARVLIKNTIEKGTKNMNPVDLDLVKEELTDVVSGFLMQKTHKTPMVIPVLIGI